MDLPLPEAMLNLAFLVVMGSSISFDEMLPFVPLHVPNAPSFISTPVTSRISLGLTEFRLWPDSRRMKIC